ncbi:MAG: PAAR domain-containing protein [Polyangiaceae bacterium]|nr:PAAR domain-containing protein [Polyangiaceae bacterium]
MHTCPQSSGPIPHVGGPILPPNAPTVQIGGRPAARMEDHAFCVGPQDTLAKGAFPVPICGNPAARMTDTTAHGGVITGGHGTVLIGLAGTGGNIWAGKAMCQAAAAGRTSGKNKAKLQQLRRGVITPDHQSSE